MIKEQEIRLLNFTMLRAQTTIYRIVDVMGTDRISSENEFVWDENSVLTDDNDSIIKLNDYEIGRYIRRTDFDTTFTPEQVDEAIDIVLNRPYFSVRTVSDITVGNAASPSILTGLTTVTPIQGFTIDAPTGSVINNTGRDIELMVGQLAVQMSKTGGADMILNIYSEYSPDGISWTNNEVNLREMTVAHDGRNFWSFPSFMVNWKDGDYVRFRVFSSGTGIITLAPPSETAEGNPIVGLSAIWEMEERR